MLQVELAQLSSYTVSLCDLMLQVVCPSSNTVSLKDMHDFSYFLLTIVLCCLFCISTFRHGTHFMKSRYVMCIYIL